MSMPSIPILLVGVGMLVLVLLALALVVRRVLVYRQPATVPCSLRRRSLGGGELWATGLLRIGGPQLRWFQALSLRPGPELVIPRGEIVEVERHRLLPKDPDAEPLYRVEMRLAHGRRSGLLLDPSSAAVLTAWLEAAPTGAVAGDAD